MTPTLVKQGPQSTISVLAVASLALASNLPCHAFVVPNAFRRTVSQSLPRAGKRDRYRMGPQLYMSSVDKNQFDQHLEDNMGGDWRQFRAQLIAQEQINIVSDAEPNDCRTEEPRIDRVENQAKHKEDSWAHPIPHIETGSILLASEQLGGKFRGAVILITEHDETKGTKGIVVNRPMSETISDLSEENLTNVDESSQEIFKDSVVSYGGRNLRHVFTIVHGYGSVDGSKQVAPGVFIGGTKALARRVILKDFHPSQALFSQGQEAWVPSQLQREINRGAWYTAAVSPDLILRHARPKNNRAQPYLSTLGQTSTSTGDLWSDIMTHMGGEYATIVSKHGNPGNMDQMQ